MESPLAFILVLAIIIFSAKAAGYLSVRLHQPAVLGELIMGLVLGPTMINLFGLEPFAAGHIEQAILYLAEAGIIFLMFMAGLEIDIGEMRKIGGAAILAGALGVSGTLLLGAIVAVAFHFSLTSAFFIGLILSATSVSISAQTLMELNLLQTREGVTILAAAVADDIIVLLLLSTAVAAAGSQANDGSAGALSVIVRSVLYLVGGTLIGVFAFPQLLRKVSALPISEGLIALVTVVALLYAWAAEAIGGMATVTGAFLAGVLFSTTAPRKAIAQGVHTITYGLLVPVFFVSIGLKANARAFDGNDLLLTLALVAVTIGGKLIGCGLGALLSGFSLKEALRVGIGMVPRGEVGLIVGAVGLGLGVITSKVFAAVVIVVLVTTLLTPVMLRSAFQGKEKA